MKAKNYTLSISPGDPGFESAIIRRSEDAEKYARQFYGDDIEILESFFIMLLNKANAVTGWVKISQGGTAGTVVDPKIVAKYAVDSLSSGVILCHNHPSGRLLASEADNQITRKIKDGLKLFDIAVLDHIILSSNGFYSYADDGNII